MREQHEHEFIEIVEAPDPEEPPYREIACKVCRVTPDEAALEEYDQQEEWA